MKKRLVLFLGFLSTVLCLMLLTEPVSADVAPPFQPPGSNVSPDSEQTMVQMVAEEVIIEVQAASYPGSLPENWKGHLVKDWAQVTATFWMVNQGSITEQFDVLFPLANPQGWGDGSFGDPEIDDLAVQVNGASVQTTRSTLPGLWNNGDPVSAAAFETAFPPGEKVLIEVSYTTLATGYPPLSTFTYFIETGAGWYGPIGTADLTVRLPYEASIENISTPDYDTLPGGVFVGNEIRWHFDDLEPEINFNLMVTMVEVEKWNEILRTRQVAEAAPQNGDAWGELARALKHAIVMNKGYLRESKGTALLLEESRAAYEKATTLKPEAALWHAGYGELIWAEVSWTSQQHREKSEKAVRELYTALQLDPGNEQALYTLYEMHYAAEGLVEEIVENQFDFLVLTATLKPYRSSTPRPTETPILSETPPQTNTPPPTKAPPTAAPTLAHSPQVYSQTPPNPTDVPLSPEPPDDKPFCAGSVALIPFTLAGLILFKRRDMVSHR
jgi:hypothetical protein